MMRKEDIIYEMDECLKYADLAGFSEQADILFKQFKQKEVAEIIAKYIYKRYTTFKEDSMSKLLEIILEKDPSIINVNHPENPLFKLSIIKGSVGLYECFMEVGLEPFIKDKNEDFIFDYLVELQLVAQELNDHFFPQYVKCIKGIDFNGVFGIYENNPSKSLINTEDYETLNDVVEKYNTIVGRRDILKKLEDRMS